MKILLLIILLQISGILTLNPDDFIDKPVSEFTNYCTEQNLDIHTGYRPQFYNATINGNITICFFNNDKTEALKVYFLKDEHSIYEVEKALKNNLYLVKKGIYIDMEDPRFLYGLIDYENEAFFALIIYKHGN